MIAVMTPGQGPHIPDMVTHLQNEDDLAPLVTILNDLAGEDVIATILEQGQNYLNRPEIVSPISLLLSLAAYRKFHNESSISFFAGYSIGQWSAMALAGMISPEDAIKATFYRGKHMAKALKTSNTGMSAIIGLPDKKIEEVIADIGDELMITNYNAPGQVSIGGTLDTLEQAEEKLAGCGAFKIARLPVKGAWHSFALNSAVFPFRQDLNKIELKAPTVPVINNVTGDFLPNDEPALKDTLAEHLAKPVLWHHGITRIIDSGCQNFVEIGYGDMLSKFGPFIHRKAKYENPVGWGAQSRRPVRKEQCAG